MAKKKKKSKELAPQRSGLPTNSGLLGDIRSFIEAARKQTARAVNSALVGMYWQIGRRIREEVLANERAEYGKQILQTLSEELTNEYGGGFSHANLMTRDGTVFVRRHMHLKTHWCLVKRYSLAADINPDRRSDPGTRVHPLRKTAITDAIRNCAGIHQVRKFAGRSDILWG